MKRPATFTRVFIRSFILAGLALLGGGLIPSRVQAQAQPAPTPTPAQAQASAPVPTTDRELIHAAEEAFRANRYHEAATIYERLTERFPNHPLLLYNLGTAYAREGRRGLAIWRYLQALERNPRDHETRENLQILAPDIIQQIAVAPIPPVDWVYHRFTANEWAALAGGATILGLLLAAIYYWEVGRERVRRRVRKLIVPLFFVALFAWPFALAHFYFEDMTWQAVVVEDKTVARTGPSENQIVTLDLAVGSVVRVRDESTPGWVKFSYGGRMGFVERSRIRFL